jgi:glycosyltransferase involved in cell wall biosynthesis
MIYVNTRILNGRLTGVQRYASEILARIGRQLTPLTLEHSFNGVRGHFWEQFILPLRLQDGLLWSPSNSGPLSVGNQVVTIHDLSPLDHPEWMSPRFAAWYQFLLPRLARKAKHLITVSEFTKGRILERFCVPEEKITVIPNAVDERFRDPPKATDLSSIFGECFSNTRYVLTVGSIEPRKNLITLTKAWQMIVDKIPEDISLVVAGARGERAIFRDASLSTMPKRVLMPGHVSDEFLPMLYANAIVFSYLSVYEGFGLPPLEGMASGVPVLTSNTTAIPEVVSDAALTVDPLDAEAVADGLFRLITNDSLNKKFSAQGILRAEQFTWETTAAKTWDVLCKAAGD